jgi:prepilin-type processing-associated H-X9-DG protein
VYYGPRHNCDDPLFPIVDQLHERVKAGPFVPSVYPEYLTDPTIIYCPSDAEDDPSQLYSPATGLMEFGYHCQGGQRGHSQIDQSYAYLGWVMDRMDDGMDGVPASFVAMIVDTIPSDFPYDIPAQFITALERLANYSGQALVNASDSDINTSASGFNNYATPPAIGVGNAGTNTIYRMREGIERFMITDINNPAASAQAQSMIYIMFDLVAIATQGYNHVPGGSNVLYMDGHVDFIRYNPPGSPAPVSAGMAALIGAIGFL